MAFNLFSFFYSIWIGQIKLFIPPQNYFPSYFIYLTFYLSDILQGFLHIS